MERFEQKDFQIYTTLQQIRVPSLLRHLAWLIVGLIVVSVVFLTFTPWVQTARGFGEVTALNPNDRAQHINALVSGRIKQWHVREGSHVAAGDVIVEIVDNDPQIIERLESERNSMKHQLEAATITAETARKNYERQKSLMTQGLSSEREVEQAKIAYKKNLANQAKASAALSQAETQLSRQNTQRITAPRDGAIMRIMSSDVATAVKAGDRLATFVPNNAPPAVELYVNGLDVSLMHPGRKVRLQFEGWPAVQFSGWPSIAIGTFGGVVEAVDPAVSTNGRFRVLVVPDDALEPWPEQRFLRYGAKVQGWVLLDTVSVGYELWRQLNNFPPRFEHAPLFHQSAESVAQ